MDLYAALVTALVAVLFIAIIVVIVSLSLRGGKAARKRLHKHTYVYASKHHAHGREWIVKKCKYCPSVLRDSP